jgi:GTPase SAR1 family protein
MKTVIEEVKSNWMIIIFIGSLIVGWTTFNARLTQAEDDITDLKTVISQFSTTNIEINTRLTKIETSVDFIKEKVK